MTYTILCDEYILHDSRNPTLRLVQPKLNLELNKNGTLTFTIYNNHPYYDNITKLKSVITVFQGETVIFKGRVIDDTMEMYKSKKVTVEGIRAYLIDSVYRPFSYQGDVSPFLQAIIDSHNAQVETFQQFILGNVTVTDPNGYINRSSIDYLSSYDVIKTRLIDILGGYLVVRYESDGNYIDYLADFTDTSTQNIEFAVNLSDLSQKVDGTSIYTGIIPLGGKLKDSDGNTTDERLTIKTVNDDKDYLVDDTTVALYGKIFEVVIWDDVTVASNLLTKAQAYLADNLSFLVTLDITAVDLNATNADIENFKVGEYIRIKSEPHGIDKLYLLKKLALDIENPSRTSIQLGESYKSLTDISVGQSNSSNDLATRIETVETHYIPNTEMTAVINETIEDNSLIQQLPTNIMSQVSQNYIAQSDFEDYQQQISTQMTQTASDVTLQFNNLTSQVTTLNGNTQQQFSNISKYIRFVNGEIVLGEVNNPFILDITNTKLSFLENNIEVAYFSNGKLHVKDGEFINSMQLGNFTFFPRANGNISFYKTQ